ncbi:tyrosine-type recombinase/integrase, partial [Cryomorpha ignava]|nr:tyrosine-type recombinase/integrase [Cryomorpha ignava]
MVETAITEVPGFENLCTKLSKSFAINGKAKSTLSNYTRCLAHLALYYKKSPETLSTELINDYLFYCQNLHKTPSESFFKHTIFGLRAIYKVLNMEAKRVKLPQIKRQNQLPVVLSKAEVRTLLKAPKYLKHRLMLAVLYGCGLRSYELCALRLSDVDFDRMTVLVKKQKGKTDRYVPLSKHLARGLKKYISTESPQTFVFNSQVTDNGAPRPITTTGVQWVIKENRSKVNTHKHITA